MSTNLPPPSPLSYEGQVVTPYIRRTTSPTTSNLNFPVPTIWINTSLKKAWILVSVALGVADWVPIGGDPGEVETITVDTFTGPGTNPVTPDANASITVTGAQVAAGTTANVIRTDSLAANAYTIQVQRSQAVASTTLADNGVSHYNSADFTVDSNGFVSSLGGAFTRLIDVDAHTAPGTDPVAPTSLGVITVTGGQVAAATTANVIQTNSLAANAYSIQVQRSKTEASTTVGSNGVCHFKSTDFAVDSNGFVSLVTPGATAITGVSQQVFTTSGTYTPHASMKYAVVQVVGAGGGGGGSAISGGPDSIAAASGGGAGGSANKVVTAAAIGASQTVTIGAGGAGGSAGSNNGVDGGTTSLGAIVSASGGIKGIGSGAGANPQTQGGAGGTGSSGDYNITGGAGGNGFGYVTGGVGFQTGGFGGTSFFGMGGAQANGSAGFAGAAYGSGGGGAATVNTGAAAAGGAGASGIVIITEYF